METKTLRITEKAIYILWGLCCSAVMVLNLFFSHVKYACRQDLISEWALLFLGLMGLGVLCFGFFRIPKERKVPLGLPALVGLLFLCFQIISVRSYYFTTKWDVETIIRNAFCAARGEPVSISYYSRYPNNLLLTRIFSLILRLCMAAGLSDEQAYAALPVFQCLISYAAGLLTFVSVREVIGDGRLALTAHGMFLLLIGLSPWVSIPYSDAAGIVLPVLIFRLSTLRPRTLGKNALRWFIIGLLGVFGYRLKPTIFIVLPAVCLVNAAAFRSADIKGIPAVVGACLAGLILGTVAADAAVSDLGPINRESAFGPAHFLAMGLNRKTMGYYSHEDVNYSGSFETSEERTRADLLLAEKRIRNMGAAGLSKHLARKLLTDYNDGTFAWTMEEIEKGRFFFKIPKETDPFFSPFIRSFYYSGGAHFRLFVNFETALWLAILALSFAAVFSRPDRNTAAVMLSVTGMFAYNLLFEARARYLYVYAPLYIILAAVGIETILKRFRPVKEKRGKRKTI